jgi:TetR/AcrR family fatty acid metabolism transcriptional regulator
MAAAEPNKVTKLDKRVRIIDAAVEVFADKGFHPARIADIARRAGVADGTIYLYFRNKEDLLICVFEEKMEEHLSALSAALEGVEGPLEQIRAFARFHFAQMREKPALALVLQVELRQSHKFLREYRPEKLWRYLDVLGEMITDGQAAGVVRKDLDPFLAKWALFGALDEISVQWILARRRERFDLHRATEQVVEMVLGGLAPRS